MKVGKKQTPQKGSSLSAVGVKFNFVSSLINSADTKTSSAVQTMAASILSSPGFRGKTKARYYSPKNHPFFSSLNCSYGVGHKTGKVEVEPLEVDDSFQPTRSELVDLVANCQAAREERKRTGAKITWSGS